MGSATYSATIILGFHCVELVECSVESAENIRVTSARLDGQPLGQLRLLSSCFPCFAIRLEKHPELLIWTEAEVYVLSIEEKLIKFYDHSDAVHAAYALGANWCLVGDASVVVVDLWQGVEILRYVHDDVFISAFWEGDQLVVKDLRDRDLRFASFDLSQSELCPLIHTGER